MALYILKLIISFFKIGIIGFGGGSALIPVIHNELVIKKQLVSEEDYVKHTVVANITPGAMPVKLCATCAIQLSTPLGSLLAAYAIALPGIVVTVMLIALFSMMGPQAISYLNYASIGITVFIIFLLLHYVAKIMNYGNVRINLITCAIAFLITSGREVREIFSLAVGLSPHSLGSPLFDLSMITVMILSFYFIFLFLLAHGGPLKLAFGITLGLVYAIVSGTMFKDWKYAEFTRYSVVLLLCTTVIVLWLRQRRPATRKMLPLDRSIIRAIALFWALPLVTLAYGILSGHLAGSESLYEFLGKIALSSVTSFGGGEAYVAVADSIFVQAGYCDADVFYGRIVPVANALPGPILVKIATAIGFEWGNNTMGPGGGLLLAALCTELSIGACTSLALVVLNYYDALKHSLVVLSLKRYILPIICGTLISTSLAMLYESMKIAGIYGCEPAGTAGVMLLCIGVTFWIAGKYRINDLVLLVGWIVASTLFMTYAL